MTNEELAERCADILNEMQYKKAEWSVSPFDKNRIIWFDFKNNNITPRTGIGGQVDPKDYKNFVMEYLVQKYRRDLEEDFREES